MTLQTTEKAYSAIHDAFSKPLEQMSDAELRDLILSPYWELLND